MSDDGGNIRPPATDETGEGAIWMITIVLLIAMIAGLFFYLLSQDGAAGNDGMAGTIKNGSATADKAGNAPDNSSGR